MSSDIEQEVVTGALKTVSVRCPRCGTRMIQSVVDDELCWVCPAQCGYPPVPVNP